MALPSIALPTARYLEANGVLPYRALHLARAKSGRAYARDAGHQPEEASFLRPPDEAATMFNKWPAAIENTQRLAAMCGADTTDTTVEGLRTDKSLSALRETAQHRLLSLIDAEHLPEEMSHRLEAELAAISRNGKCLAWLALHRIVQMSMGEGTAGPARRRSIPLGAPLGMADGSLVAYALGLNPLDPMPYPPPTWLASQNVEQALPLPGIEVPASRRDVLLSALTREYGPGAIAHAGCPIHITPTAAIQAAATALGIADDTLRDLISAIQQQGWAGLGAAQESALKNIARSLRGAPVSFKPDPDTLLLLPPGGNTHSWQPPLLTSDSGEPRAWVPWPEDAICSLPIAAIRIQPSSALSLLDHAISLAEQYPSPGIVAADVDPSAFPNLNEEATQAITKGQTACVPYLSAKVVKGAEGDLTSQAIFLLVARSITQHPTPSHQPPTDINIWSSATQDTGGTLLYKDQFATIAEKAAGTDPNDIATLRFAALNPDAKASIEMRSRFVAGCRTRGLEGEQAEALWKALTACSTYLVSRYAVIAWARIAMWCAAIKAGHPAALLAASLAVSWGRNHGDLQLILAEARRLAIHLRPPDANRSHPLPTLERDGTGWAILWGLALLPGWSREAACRFVGARPKQGFASLRDLALAAVSADLTPGQVETLIRSGACDRLGATKRSRDALLELLPSMMQWAQSSRSSQSDQQLDLFASAALDGPPQEDTATNAPPSPRERYVQRAWEEQHLGVGFTSAAEMDGLHRTLDLSGNLRTRLLTSTQIGPPELGRSIYVVGLLCSVEIHTDATTPAGNGKSHGQDTTLAVACLEDLDGSIEVVAFPASYKRHMKHWTEGSLVIVTGRVSQHPDGELYLLCEHLAPYHNVAEEEEISLKIKAGRKNAAPPTAPGPSGPPEPMGQQPTVGPDMVPVQPPEPARAAVAVVESPASAPPTYKLIITLPASEDDHADIDRMIALNRLLEQHPGDDVVVLRIPYLPEAGAVTTAQLSRRVRNTPALETRIRNLLGYDSLATIRLAG
jgi:DNA polymerase-3 subunit alpha